MSEKPFVIEFRNGRFLVTLDADSSGPFILAMRFASREDAEQLMRENEWILFHGGCVLERPKVEPGTIRVDKQQLADGYKVYRPDLVRGVTSRPFTVVKHLPDGGAIVVDPAPAVGEERAAMRWRGEIP